jgi:hypothetical protein
MSSSSDSDDDNDVGGADLDALIRLETALKKDPRVYDTHVQVRDVGLPARRGSINTQSKRRIDSRMRVSGLYLAQLISAGEGG